MESVLVLMGHNEGVRDQLTTPARATMLVPKILVRLQCMAFSSVHYCQRQARRMNQRSLAGQKVALTWVPCYLRGATSWTPLWCHFQMPEWAMPESAGKKRAKMRRL